MEDMVKIGFVLSVIVTIKYLGRGVNQRAIRNMILGSEDGDRSIGDKDAIQVDPGHGKYNNGGV